MLQQRSEGRTPTESPAEYTPRFTDPERLASQYADLDLCWNGRLPAVHDLRLFAEKMANRVQRLNVIANDLDHPHHRH